MKVIILCSISFLFATALYAQTNKVTEFVKVYTQPGNDGSIALNVDNKLPVPAYIAFDLVLDNMESDKGAKFEVLVEPGIGRQVCIVKQISKSKAFKYSYKCNFSAGNPLLTPDREYPYGLPFPKDKGYRVSQGPNGPFSHQNLFAVDFSMPEGTPIYAARDGIVVMTKSDSNSGGPSKDLVLYGNFVAIYHADGTVANYYHLKLNGVAVKQGAAVKKGDLLGYSGNTGFSGGPHLHFDITQPDRQTAIPVKLNFCINNGTSVCDFQKGQQL